MGQTSIKDTVLGQSVVGYTFQTTMNLKYTYYHDEKCSYAELTNNNTNDIFIAPVIFKVIDIYVKKIGIGDTYLILKIKIDNYIDGVMFARPENIGFIVPQKPRDREKYWLDKTNYSTNDVDQVMKMKRHLIEMID